MGLYPSESKSEKCGKYESDKKLTRECQRNSRQVEESHLEKHPILTKLSSKASNVLTITILCLSMLSVGSGYSLLAPFFPTKAKSKQISELWIGLIVSQYQIAVIFGSPYFGKLATRIKPKTGLSLGLLICGIGDSLMALIEWTPDGSISTYLAMLFKTIEGLGAAAVFTNVWTIIFKDFPENMSKLFATTEMCYGVGLIVGPALGGILYQFGEEYFDIGFSLPFWTFGSFLVLNAIIVEIVIPNNDTEQTFFEAIDTLKLLKNFGFTLCVAITINSALLIGFNEATLDLHLLTIEKLSPSTKGAIFLLFGLTYTIVSQIFGYLGDKIKDCYPLCLIGCGASLVCFVVVGPLPFINIESSLTLVIIGQILLGIGLGGQFIGSFIQGYREIINSGFPENMSTYAVLAGVFSSSYAIGCAVGPIIGGYMLGQWGYRHSTTPLLILQIIMILAIIFYKLMGKRNYTRFV